MTNFKEMLDDVEALAKKDLGTSVAFRDLLETIACYLNDIDNQASKPVRVIDIVILTCLLLNLMTTWAVYMMVR